MALHGHVGALDFINAVIYTMKVVNCCKQTGSMQFARLRGEFMTSLD